MEPMVRVADLIERAELLRPRARVVVGVSGGADSLCLLLLLQQFGFQAVAAHFDHGWRKTSWAEAEFVLRVAARLGLPGVAERALSSAPPGSGAEERARQARYAFLARAAAEHSAEAVAVGHTADDQVETVLMHWIRGAGPEGLRGMAPASDWPFPPGPETARPPRLIRPLLVLRRSETEALCRAFGEVPRRDPSNLDRRFFRNRLRHDVLPLLESLNPGFRQGLLRSAQVMDGVASYLGQQAEAWLDRHAAPAGRGALELPRGDLGSMPAALSRSVLRAALRRLAPDLRDIGFDGIERLRSAAASPQDRATVWMPGGVEARIERDRIWLRRPGASLQYRWFPQLPAGVSSIKLPVPGTVELENGWRVSARRARGQAPDPRSIPKNRLLVWVDSRSLAGNLIVRPPRPRERMRPLGMRGHARVSEILAGEHVPAPARVRWPVLVSGDSIVWLVAVRLGHDARLTPDTRRSLILEVHPATEGSGLC
jgi:tRNA(Ile)-lysidine synthase